MFLAIGTVYADPSLVGHWKLDEGTGPTAIDSSGNGNDGTLIGAPGPSWTTGKIGQALDFDGTDDYVAVPFILDLSTTDMTTTVWIYASGEDTTNDSNSIVQQENGTGIGRTWLRRASSSSTSHLPKIVFSFIGARFLESTTLIELNTWYFVVVTVEGTTRKIYVNGIEEDSNTNTPEASDGAMRIGSQKAGVSGEKWEGIIDDVRIYNRALSGSEIEKLFNMGNVDAVCEIKVDRDETEQRVAKSLHFETYNTDLELLNIWNSLFGVVPETSTDDIVTLLRLQEEFEFDLVLHHAYEAHISQTIIDELVKRCTRLPTQLNLGLAGIAKQGLDLGWPEVTRINS